MWGSGRGSPAAVGTAPNSEESPPAKQGTAEHEVEGHLFPEMLALGAQLLAAFLKLVGSGDLGKEVSLKDGRTMKRFAEQHERRLLTVFGEFQVLRGVHGIRPGQKIEVAPADRPLQLPEGDLPYVNSREETPSKAGRCLRRSTRRKCLSCQQKQPVDQCCQRAV